jgi:pimeloyl-ACP methyl ester carboxylesterase
LAIEPFAVRTTDVEIRGLRAGRGFPLILLHGWPEYSAVWTKCMRRLAERFQVFAPDLRGFGQTRQLAEPRVLPKPEVLAEDLRQLLGCLGLSRVGLVAHDVGAVAAQSFAQAHPSSLSGLFFFNCPYPGIGRRWGEPDHLKQVWYQYFQQTDLAWKLVGHSRDTCRIYLKHFLDHWAAKPGLFDSDLEMWVDTFMANGNVRRGFEWYIAVNDSRLRTMKDGAPRSPRIGIPAYFLWGRKDPVLKAEWTDRLEEYFSDCRVEIAEEAGHFVHYESPELAASRIHDFFSRSCN